MEWEEEENNNSMEEVEEGGGKGLRCQTRSGEDVLIGPRSRRHGD